LSSAFPGFPPETIRFLSELRKHNNKEWFQAHVDEYQAFCIEPAKQFVEAAGREIRKFAPNIRAEPRVLGSIFRITRDTRYAGQDQPYKHYLDFYFWEGERKRAVSGLFTRLSPDFIGIGAGCHQFEKEQLRVFRQALTVSKNAIALVSLARKLKKQGYKIRGEHYKRLPKDMATIADARCFLLFKALYVHVDEPAHLVSTDSAMMSACVLHWRRLANLHSWLTDHIQKELDRR
jgi:uncharacterized protein (TIGR02453 family)